MTVLGENGLTQELQVSVWTAATRVVAGGVEVMSGDLSKEDPSAAGSVVALPLVCRGRALAVLVGLDPLPSATAPAPGEAVLAALCTLMEPIAIALDNALLIRRFEALSITDDLTGLSNSHNLKLVLRLEVKRAVRSKKSLSVLFIDMDGFKTVNTLHGHLAGSEALVEVGWEPDELTPSPSKVKCPHVVPFRTTCSTFSYHINPL